MEDESSEDSGDDYILGQVLNQYQANGTSDAEYFQYEQDNMGDMHVPIDSKLLMSDSDGQALLEQQKLMHREKRVFVEHQRKLHEASMREHKEFMTLVNKIKTNPPVKQNNNFDDLLKECQTVLESKEHPVFVELSKGEEEMKVAPWSKENKDKLKVLRL